ncbi:MAG: sodium:alanine symporter family protein [Candidatus Auribacter fodinae]|jgi:AGCS family alanine or glycine:cation symporter|uniref:Sodium:alanine symporter family protein n=1 Tax=Candidatus Auribacter fodinae TaxID=2093366 RepID=A0A3A4QTX2_9BACT|nr:MAG: sodium:alanine symporter family protein [Candidatus Auribacter fodinae]
MTIPDLIAKINSFVWGIPLMVLLVGTGLFLTSRMKFVQFRGFKHACSILRGKYDRPGDPGEITHFRALATALSATIGTGNIVGVATAVMLGGPGAVFWMWVTALVGMATKFTSCTLAVHFRKIDEQGEAHGGPMHFIEQGLGKRFRWLACMFAFFTATASLGIGNMFQINNVSAAINTLIFGYGQKPVIAINVIVGLIGASLVAMVILGGIKRIAQFSGKILPVMCLFYVIGGLIILIKNYDLILPGLQLIFTKAFSAPESVSGGLLGGVIRHGVARGLFSNEAGMGSAAIAHGAAKTNEPVREGLVAMLGPFIDTIIVCSITGLVIICTGAFDQTADSAKMTSLAFDIGLAGSGWMVSVGILFFAFSTLVSWSYYGDRAVDYLFGKKAVTPYRIVYVIFVFIGAISSFPTVICFCDTMNGLMAIPNLIAIAVLSPLVARLAADYFKRMNS